MRKELVLDVRGCSLFSSSSRCGDDDDDKRKKKMRYARVTKRTPPKRDLGLVRVDDEQLTCGAKLTRRRHVRDFESDENVHARARQVRGRRETTGGSGKLREGACSIDS